MILILGDDTTAMPILKDNKKKEQQGAGTNRLLHNSM